MNIYICLFIDWIFFFILRYFCSLYLLVYVCNVHKIYVFCSLLVKMNLKNRFVLIKFIPKIAGKILKYHRNFTWNWADTNYCLKIWYFRGQYPLFVVFNLGVVQQAYIYYDFFSFALKHMKRTVKYLSLKCLLFN